MRQQINLYQDVLIKRREILCARQAAIVLMAVLLVLVVLGVYGFYQGATLIPERDRLDQEVRHMQQQIAELGRQYPPREISPALQQEVAGRERLLRDLHLTLDTLLPREQGRNAEIISALEGLAGRSHQGLWLNRIHLLRQGREIELRGRALNPDGVPMYLQWLVDEDIFPGISFAHLRMTRLDEQPDHVEFVLGTAGTGR